MSNKGIEKFFDDLYELDFIDLYKLLLKRKISIISSISTIMLISLLALIFLVPNQFTSSAVLLSADDTDSDMDLLQRYSGLASIAGISVGMDRKDKTLEAIEIIQSHDFFVNSFLKNIQLHDLMAVKRWDPKNNIISYNKKDFDPDSGVWVRKVKFPKKIIPSSQEAHIEYLDILNIDYDKKTGFLLISITHQSPYIAKNWLDLIISEINRTMRSHDREKTKKSLEFLEKESQKVQFSEIYDALATLQQKELKSLMLIEVNEEYVFRVVSSPLVPEKKSGPNKIIYLILIFICFTVLIILFSVFREIYLNKLKEQSSF